MKLDPMQGLSFPRAPQRSDTGVAAPVSSPGDDAHSRGALFFDPSLHSADEPQRLLDAHPDDAAGYYDSKAASRAEVAGDLLAIGLVVVLIAGLGVAGALLGVWG